MCGCGFPEFARATDVRWASVCDHMLAFKPSRTRSQQDQRQSSLIKELDEIGKNCANIPCMKKAPLFISPF